MLARGPQQRASDAAPKDGRRRPKSRLFACTERLRQSVKRFEVRQRVEQEVGQKRQRQRDGEARRADGYHCADDGMSGRGHRGEENSHHRSGVTPHHNRAGSPARGARYYNDGKRLLDMRPSFVLIYLLSLVFAASPVRAQKVSLYLASGGEISVREYVVEGERVRYYSLDRSQWEEVPLRIVDLEKTQSREERSRKRLEAMRAESRAERIAERKARTELHYVPIEDGIYRYLDQTATYVAQSEVITDKSTKRGILKLVSPIPMIAGKNVLSVTGVESPLVFDDLRPVFFVRQLNMAKMGIVRLTPEPKKKRRVVQVIEVNPTTKEMFEQQEDVKIFRQQLASGVYRIWPVEDLEPGEYAVVDYTPGEANLRVWDFSVQTPGTGGDVSAP